MKVSVYDKQLGETKTIRIRLFDWQFFLFVFISCVIGVVGTIITYKNLVGITEGQIAPASNGQFTTIIFAVIGVMGIAILIMLGITRKNSKDYMYWVCLVKYQDLADDLKKYGIKVNNKKIGNLIGQKLYDEFKRRWPEKEYDEDWIYDSVLFKREYKNWIEKHGKDKLKDIVDEIMFEDNMGVEIPPVIEEDIPYPDNDVERDVSFSELIPPLSSDEQITELQKLIDETLNRKENSYSKKEDELIKQLEELL